MIFNIQRYSTHDGSGIRTNIFFKGCPLHCSWCSNPESQSKNAEIMYDRRFCKRFGECIRQNNKALKFGNKGIEINRELIEDISIYRDVCPANALMIAGEHMTVEDLLKEIKKDMVFYSDSKGGVTLTGGEPFVHKELVKNLLLRLKKEDISASLETCLHIPWSRIVPLIEFVDEFLVDLKHFDPQKFKRFTGGNVDLVLNNIRHLDDMEIPLIIRIPVIPTFNHTFTEMKKMIDFAASLKYTKEVHFIPFHNLGKEKYRMLGRDYEFEKYDKVSENELDQYVQYAIKNGLTTNIGG